MAHWDLCEDHLHDVSTDTRFMVADTITVTHEDMCEECMRVEYEAEISEESERLLEE